MKLNLFIVVILWIVPNYLTVTNFFHPGVAHTQGGDVVELQCIALVVHLLQICENIPEQIVTESDIGPVFQIDIAHGHWTDSFLDGDVLPVYYVAYRRTVLWKVAAIHILTADTLADGITILILAVADDYGVRRSLDAEDMTRYWHNIKYIV